MTFYSLKPRLLACFVSIFVMIRGVSGQVLRGKSSMSQPLDDDPPKSSDKWEYSSNKVDISNEFQDFSNMTRQLQTNRYRRPVQFYAMGDAPYGKVERHLLRLQMKKLDHKVNDYKVDFMAHVGDMKGSEPICLPWLYNEVATILKTSPVPTYIVPGDNDYHDCINRKSAWTYYTRYFKRFDKNWKKRYEVRYQQNRDENFSFIRRGVLVIGVHLLGGSMRDPNEWNARLRDNLVWVKALLEDFSKRAKAVVILGHTGPSSSQKLFFDGLVKEAKRFKKPILYIHGDGHCWKQDRPFKARNMMRVMVDQGGKADPVLVTVDLNNEQPFHFQRRKVSTQK